MKPKLKYLDSNSEPSQGDRTDRLLMPGPDQRGVLLEIKRSILRKLVLRLGNPPCVLS